MTSETYPKHLPEVRVPEAERNIRDMQSFRGRFTLWIFTALWLWLLAICLCSPFCLLSKEINNIEWEINIIISWEICKIIKVLLYSKQKLQLSLKREKKPKMLSMFKNAIVYKQSLGNLNICRTLGKWVIT